MLMDEPFSAVDPVVRAQLQDEFLRLQAELGKTIAFVTHDIDEAIKLGDRVEPDVTAIAAPIRRPGGIAGALNLLGPTYRIDDRTMDDYGQIVAREAEGLAAQLGVHHEREVAG